MTFHDLTILEGGVRSRRIFDTRELLPKAVLAAAEMLRPLRAGAPEAYDAFDDGLTANQDFVVTRTQRPRRSCKHQML